MRMLIMGGTKAVGPAAVRHLDGHDVAVAHTGAHEHADVAHVEHLHGGRDALLAPGGPVERWRPDAIVDTFPGGATAAKARALAACATRAGTAHLIPISSMDVYLHAVHAGLGDGTGAVLLPPTPLPLTEDAPLRDAPYPGATPEGHDNVAMERALHGWGRVTALRPGAIYGPFPGTRERTLVELVARGEHRLPLPAGGVQLFHRVAVDRVGRAIAAALEHAPDGFWACNVADPYDWEYAGLAGEVGRLLDWEWAPEVVPFDAVEHPWRGDHHVFCDTERLRRVLRVTEPDPRDALAECVAFLARDLGVRTA